MKEKQKTIYYCDFCKKHQHMRGAMQRHETRCTLNPDRVCGVRGCEGDCPWCVYSKKRLAGEPIGSDLSEDMQAWWKETGTQMSSSDDAAYEAIY